MECALLCQWRVKPHHRPRHGCLQALWARGLDREDFTVISGTVFCFARKMKERLFVTFSPWSATLKIRSHMSGNENDYLRAGEAQIVHQFFDGKVNSFESLLAGQGVLTSKTAEGIIMTLDSFCSWVKRTS